MEHAPEILPGPKAVFVSGLPHDLEMKILPLLTETGVSDIRIVFCTAGMMEATLLDALEKEFSETAVGEDKLPPVMVFSGISFDEVQAIVSGYKNTGLPRPIFATTTVHNLNFTVKELIMHLLEERREQLHGNK